MGKRRLPVSAEWFELPVDDPKHRDLRDTAWIGGSYHEGQYFLGRFLGTNEYASGFEAFDVHIRECVRAHLPKLLWLLQSSYLHEFMVIWLKDAYRQTDDNRRFPFRAPTKEERAIVLAMENPEISDVRVRQRIGCTEKTMLRWTMYQLLRREQQRLSKTTSKRSDP